MNRLSFESSIGIIVVSEEGGCIASVGFSDHPISDASPTPLLLETENQIREYLSGGRRGFTVPIAYDLGEFGNSVLDSMRRIPYGETATYGGLARSSGHPNAYRAVGTVCRRNPLPIIIPCHRIVPSSGGIGNYAYGREVKKRLLELESYQRSDVRGGGYDEDAIVHG